MDKDQILHLDYQTLTELEILPQEKSGLSVFDILNKTVTPGGADLLRKRFRKPLNQRDDILKIQDAVKYIMYNTKDWDLIAFKELMDQVEFYFYSKTETVSSINVIGLYFEGTISMLRFKNFRKTVNTGTRNTIRFFSTLSAFCSMHDHDNLPSELARILSEIMSILRSPYFSKLLRKNPEKVWSVADLLFYDKIFRDLEKESVIRLVHLTYELDVLTSMARSVKDYQLVFPEILDSSEPIFCVDGIYHLFLKAPVGNYVEFPEGENFMFLTGPNMAGKTTLLKSCGIAVFLAHLGLGVPAKSMKLTVFNCLFSSLNTTDNLSIGYSYFYSEVIRIKKAAEALNHHKRVFMLFDELFKGTNIKDAYDGSIMVIDGLMNWKSGMFILSSHLVELASEIRKYSGIFFQYFDSTVVQGKPSFNFKLLEGISEKRLGLLILKNEKIIDLLAPADEAT